MIKLAFVCFGIALIAAILGFGGLAGAFAKIAVWLFVIAAVLFVLFLILGVLAGKKIKDRL